MRMSKAQARGGFKAKGRLDYQGKRLCIGVFIHLPCVGICRYIILVHILARLCQSGCCLRRVGRSGRREAMCEAMCEATIQAGKFLVVVMVVV